MKRLLTGNDGSALVTALFFITALSLTATVIVWVTSSERRVTQNEYSQTRSFYATDAGSEQAINWIRTRPFPPDMGPSNVVVDQTAWTAMTADHKFQFDITFAGKGIPIQEGGHMTQTGTGSGAMMENCIYTIETEGVSSSDAQTAIEVSAAMMFRIGY